MSNDEALEPPIKNSVVLRSIKGSPAYAGMIDLFANRSLEEINKRKHVIPCDGHDALAKVMAVSLDDTCILVTMEILDYDYKG